MKIQIKLMIPEATELAEVIMASNKYGFDIDIDDYSYIICEYEYKNVPKTIFETIYNKNNI